MVRVAHVAVVTPNQAGLYETTRDLVAAEREMGVDARIVDPVNDGMEMVDRGVPVVGADFVRRAAVVVNHSGLSRELNKTRLPIVHVLHGRPHSSFLLEQAGKIKVYSYLQSIREDVRYRLFVTFWAEFVGHWELILPRERIRYVQPPVDLERWTEEGPGGYGFHGKGGEVNVVCASMWREDKTPYHIVNAFALFAQDVPGARLHIYAAPQRGDAWGVLRRALEERGVLGECVGMVRGLDNVYRAADVAITPHRIATRSVREALACGCNVVMAPGNHYTPFLAEPEDLETYAIRIAQAVNRQVRGRVDNRRTAEMFFDAQKTARQFVSLLEDVVNGKY